MPRKSTKKPGPKPTSPGRTSRARLSKSNSAHHPPAVAGADLDNRILAAARAAGFTDDDPQAAVECLANAMVDGGYTATMPNDPKAGKDGLLDSYTLRDLGKRKWAEMLEAAPTQRQEWFQTLNDVQAAALITTLREEGFPTQVIARDLGITDILVTKTFNQHADRLGAQVVGLRLNTIAGQMQMIAEKAQAIELENNNGRAVWAIEKERIQTLQNLGIVDRAIHKVEVSHKFDEQKQAEIDALLELERKKQVRHEEIKQIEATVVDAPPLLGDDAE